MFCLLLVPENRTSIETGEVAEASPALSPCAQTVWPFKDPFRCLISSLKIFYANLSSTVQSDGPNRSWLGSADQRWERPSRAEGKVVKDGQRGERRWESGGRVSEGGGEGGGNLRGKRHSLQLHLRTQLSASHNLIISHTLWKPVV